MPRYVLGIDPGWTGGACLLEDVGQDVGRLCTGFSFDGLSDGQIYGKVSDLAFRAEIAAIEYVNGRRANGTQNAFRFGESYGLLQGALYSALSEFEKVTPGKWQADLGCLSGGDKWVLVNKADQLWPGFSFTKTGERGWADAALIAEWLLRRYPARFDDGVGF